MIRRHLGLGVGVLLAAWSGSPVLAQEEAAAIEEASPNTGDVSLELGVDWTTHYFFAGLLQEDQGIILQPYGYVTFGLYESEEVINSISITGGFWNSFHDEKTFNTSGPDTWYEADLSAGVSVGFCDRWAMDTVYLAYTSPNGGFDTVQEIDLTLSLDDSDIWPWGFALNPSATVAFELDGQTDQNADPAGTSEGIYLEFAIEPSFNPFPDGDLAELTLSFPVAVGLSIDDYYEDGTGGDDTYGYTSVGVAVSIPMSFIPTSFGEWTLGARVDFYFLGDFAEEVNNDDDFEAVGTLSLGMSY